MPLEEGISYFAYPTGFDPRNYVRPRCGYAWAKTPEEALKQYASMEWVDAPHIPPSLWLVLDNEFLWEVGGVVSCP